MASFVVLEESYKEIVSRPLFMGLKLINRRLKGLKGRILEK